LLPSRADVKKVCGLIERAHSLGDKVCGP